MGIKGLHSAIQADATGPGTQIVSSGISWLTGPSLTEGLMKQTEIPVPGYNKQYLQKKTQKTPHKNKLKSLESLCCTPETKAIL